MRDRPFALFGAAGLLAVQTVGLCIASVLSAVDTADGRSYERSSGIALTVIGFAAAAAFAWVATGLVQARRWSFTPAVLIQLFTLIVGIYLLQSHRYEWGVPAVALAVAAAVLLLLPGSLDALGRKPPPAEDGPERTDARAAKNAPGTARSTKTASGTARSTKSAPGAARPSRPRSGRP
ncbi:MAG TPA: hypothetical protein VGM53_01755 [Streptosporangiaceae bacterium]|jgi:hypothetical protein